MSYLKRYQAANSLKDDGILGPVTLGVLLPDLDIPAEYAAHFFGQCAHESASFSRGRENMNYSATGLRKVFRRHFSDYEFALYQRKPEAIANRVYANRMGNGPENSGDGWRYRGVGPIQLTGKANIQAYFRYAGLPEDSTPELILLPEHYFASAKFFFDSNNLWRLIPDILRLSKAINVGSPDSKVMPHGLADRIAQTRRFEALLKQVSYA